MSALWNVSVGDELYPISPVLLSVIHKLCEQQRQSRTNACAQYTSLLHMFHSSEEAEEEEEGGGVAATFGGRVIPYSVLCVAGVLFNALCIGAMVQIRSAQWSCHHLLLLNLAACDLLGSVLLWLYHNSPALFPHFHVSSLRHCVFISIVLVAPFILTLCNSSCNLLLLAVNLYLAICHPLLSIRSRGVLRAMVAVIWLASLTLASVPLLIMLSLNHSHDCAAYAVDMGVKSLEISAYVLVAVIFIAIVLYVRVYHVIAHYRTVGVATRRGRGRDENARNYKAFLTTLLLAGSLFVFWLPYMVFHFLTAHLHIDLIPDIVLHIKFYCIDFLPLLHFLTDPAIYGLRLSEIRRGYKKLLCRHRRRRKQQQHRTSVDTRVTLLRFSGRNSEARNSETGNTEARNSVRNSVIRNGDAHNSDCTPL
jgi:hypothetical protein